MSYSHALWDPDLEVAQGRIECLRRGNFGEKWAETKAYRTYQEMLDSPVREPLTLLVEATQHFDGLEHGWHVKSCKLLLRMIEVQNGRPLAVTQQRV